MASRKEEKQKYLDQPSAQHPANTSLSICQISVPLGHQGGRSFAGEQMWVEAGPWVGARTDPGRPVGVGGRKEEDPCGEMGNVR